MKIPVHWLAAAALASALAGCGGGGSSDAGCSVFGCASSGDGAASSASGTGTVATSSAGTVVLSLSSSTISASTPGTVTALVKNADGTPAAETLVTFAVTNSSAAVSPARVKTDAQGNASTTLTPASGAIGADYVTASAEVGSSATVLSTRAVFTVSSVTTQLTAIAASPASISAYGASVITATVTGASSSSPVTVTFSSTCAGSATPQAVLSPTTVTVTGTTASTTYQDKGCGATDRISAVINGTSAVQRTDLVVAAPVAQSLEFVSASPATICLAGSGCPVSSLVSFRVRNQNGDPVAGVQVNFALDFPNVASLQQTSVPTNQNGVAEVSVTAKSVPSPLRVRGSVTLAGGGTLSTVSNVLAINSGLPTSRAVSFSADKYNVDGLEIDGTVSNIRVQLNDRFGNAVPDGTAVSFVAEGASVIPARCVTADGVCSVKFVSSNFRPADGRVTVVAYAQGEESFDDTDGNNLYTSGESFNDIGKVFIDKNENGSLDSALGEYIVGDDPNGLWDGNVYVRPSRRVVFTLSSSAVVPRLLDAGGAAWSADTTVFHPTPSSCRVQQILFLRDSNTVADALGGNPIPAGAVLSLTTKANGASVSIDGSPVSGLATEPTRHVVTVELSDCGTPLVSGGALDLTVQMPNSGPKYIIPIGTVQ